MIEWLNSNIGFVTAIVGCIAAMVGLVTVFAIFRAPIVALRIQKNIEDYKEQKKRKFEIFRTLLATRANTTSLEHVQALNMIDIEYYEEKNISQLWNIYRDHLNSYPQNQDKAAEDRWEEKRIDCLTDMLHSMSVFFGYDLDKVVLKKGAYSPRAHGIWNLEQNLIRRGVIELLMGEKPMKVQLVEKKQDDVMLC